ncbi:MAG: hypothetical protein H0X03_00955 [Nitrosopumilus sp.]|nr:hypothetical protein [Nitrosopumilus sp.]
MDIKIPIFITAIIIVTSVTTTSLLMSSTYATLQNTDTITCQSQQGTTMGGNFHFGGNCQGENGGAVYGGGFNTDSKACEGHAVQGPYDNTHFRGGCINK